MRKIWSFLRRLISRRQQPLPFRYERFGGIPQPAWPPPLVFLDPARERGVVPNLTTSGIYDEQVLGRLCAWTRAGLFGQINVSLDGVGDDYAAVRGFSGFAQADRALVALRRESTEVGINCVVTSRSF